jgi:hypothetical protein
MPLGKEEVLGARYFLLHTFDYSTNIRKTTGYDLIKAFEDRKTYAEVLKATRGVPEVNVLAKLYCMIKGVDENCELSSFDYKFLFVLVSYGLADLINSIKNCRLPNIRFLLRNVWSNLKWVSRLQTFPEADRGLQLEIGQEIEKAGGVIKYLGVDEKLIKGLNEKCAHIDYSGVKLFTDMLVEKHKELSSGSAPVGKDSGRERQINSLTLK